MLLFDLSSYYRRYLFNHLPLFCHGDKYRPASLLYRRGNFGRWDYKRGCNQGCQVLQRKYRGLQNSLRLGRHVPHLVPHRYKPHIDKCYSSANRELQEARWKIKPRCHGCSRTDLVRAYNRTCHLGRSYSIQTPRQDGVR